MIETKLDIINKLGLHARAAAKVVSVASRYESRIHVIHNGKPIDARQNRLPKTGFKRGDRVAVNQQLRTSRA